MRIIKVIFLDFDGVLNSEKYVRTCGECGVIIDPSRMILLKQIIDATGAEIVLSTSWREHWDEEPQNCDNIGIEINNIFGQYGLHIFGKIPILNCCREDEIAAWLKSNKQVENFAVLDDRFLDSEWIRGHFVKTSGYSKGLDETSADKAIGILNG